MNTDKNPIFNPRLSAFISGYNSFARDFHSQLFCSRHLLDSKGSAHLGGPES
jgi:hypothetical protein